MIRKRMQKLWNRYNPRRTYIDCDEDFIILMSQLGYLELYRGEWFFTESGHEALEAGIKIMEEEYANIHS